MYLAALAARASLLRGASCDLPAGGAMLPAAARPLWGPCLVLRGAALRFARYRGLPRAGRAEGSPQPATDGSGRGSRRDVETPPPHSRVGRGECRGGLRSRDGFRLCPGLSFPRSPVTCRTPTSASGAPGSERLCAAKCIYVIALPRELLRFIQTRKLLRATSCNNNDDNNNNNEGF